MPEFAFVELPEGFDRFLWREFVAEFDFRRARRPVIREPVPSVTWTLPPCGTSDRPFPDSTLPVAQVVCDVLRDCVECWDSVFHHDGVHPSTQYRPHRVTDIRDLDRWEYSHYPNGDYSIFVAKDLSFGVVGDPYEQSLCFFGAQAVTAAENHNHGVLAHALRRNGISVPEHPPWRPVSPSGPGM
ncbi:DUF2716 domain-containing protein [Lentzea sp. NPDC092896]|uniref:DUF2716 domain-containing protein n=1 Tax=Lentzea sp. NPDC092896 TaxID=3364127 RepID=UPI00381480F4